MARTGPGYSYLWPGQLSELDIYLTGKEILDIYLTICQEEGTFMPGIVVSLHSAPQAHASMIFLPVAHLVPGKGIEGDRFYTHPRLPQPGTKTPYEVTLVEQEALEALHALQPGTWTEPGGRRNIVIRSCPLHTLAGCLFRIGEVLLQGAALRDAPCDSPEHTQHSICEGLHHQWLGASILTEGFVYPGDPIENVSFCRTNSSGE